MRSNKKGPRKKETEEILKSAVENLISQEVRFLQLDRINPPPFILKELSLSIIESKRKVVLLIESLTAKGEGTSDKKNGPRSRGRRRSSGPFSIGEIPAFAASI